MGEGGGLKKEQSRAIEGGEKVDDSRESTVEPEGRESRAEAEGKSRARREEHSRARGG